MEPDHAIFDERFHQDDVAKSLIKKFADYPASRLNVIITNYLSYEPGAVMAALYLSVQKGLISYNLKEQLQVQIESNFKRHKNHIQSYDWEKNNSFVKYVSACTDDQIYEIIEKPGDIVIDVYYAVLTVAKERELISEEDFKIYCRDAKSGTLIGRYSIFNNASQSPSDNCVDTPGEEELEDEKEKFWKCPNCNQIVGIEFGACWNCSTEVPEVIEHPGKADSINEIREAEPKRKGNLIRSGFTLLVFGILIAVYEHNRVYYSSFAQHTRFLEVGFGIFIAIAGLAMLLFGIWMHFRREAD
jgi:hypothetical protein